jgi:hypothetical protein
VDIEVEAVLVARALASTPRIDVAFFQAVPDPAALLAMLRPLAGAAQAHPDIPG